MKRENDWRTCYNNMKKKKYLKEIKFIVKEDKDNSDATIIWI